MNYRQFGKTDLHVSEVGFGAWAIGGAAEVGGIPIGWGNTDDATSARAVDAAVDAGINFFDTADFYGLGHSEELLGNILKDKKDVLIATKVGQRNVDDKIVLDYSKPYLINACEESLRRLKRDSIDYYQLHAARLQHLQHVECIDAMEQLQKEGKIRYWGLSLNTFHPEPEADFLLSGGWGDGVQLVFNLVNQRASKVMEKMAANDYGIIARMPLQFGLLTGKFSPASLFEKDDHRSFRLSKEILERSTRLLQEKVWPVADSEGFSRTSLALSYILSFPEISTIIPGIRTAEQVAANTEGLRILSNETRERLHSLIDEWEPIVQLMEQQG